MQDARIFLFLLGVVLTTSSMAASFKASSVITGFKVGSFGADYVNLVWDLTPYDDTIRKYTLLIDNDISTDIVCKTPHCEHIQNYLDACVVHTYELTPHFGPSTADIIGDAVSTKHTIDKEPGPPSSITTTDISVSWTEPSTNMGCVDHYKICFTVNEQPLCDSVGSSSLVYTNTSWLPLCSTIPVSVNAVTSSGLDGIAAVNAIDTPIGTPGKVTKVDIWLCNNNTIEIDWNNPIENPACAVTYAIIVGETIVKNHQPTIIQVPADGSRDVSFAEPACREPNGAQHHATYSDLVGCTNYTIDIYALSLNNQRSPLVRNYQATEDTTPSGPDSMNVTQAENGQIIVSWENHQKDYCAVNVTVCYNDGFHPEQVCVIVPPCDSVECGGGGTGGTGSVIINDFLYCSTLSFSVFGLSPGGIPSTPALTSVITTPDAAPGPVRNLVASETTATSLTITYDPPELNPQCVREYEVVYVNLNVGSRNIISPKSLINNTFSPADACSPYNIYVTPTSATGLRGPTVTTSTTTLEGIPSVPQEFRSVLETENTLYLQWFRPGLNRFCTSSYQLRCSTGGVPVVAVTVFPDNPITTFQMNYPVTGLSPTTEYVCTVAAVTPSLQNGPVAVGNFSTK